MNNPSVVVRGPEAEETVEVFYTWPVFFTKLVQPDDRTWTTERANGSATSERNDVESRDPVFS